MKGVGSRLGEEIKVQYAEVCTFSMFVSIKLELHFVPPRCQRTSPTVHEESI